MKINKFVYGPPPSSKKASGRSNSTPKTDFGQLLANRTQVPTAAEETTRLAQTDTVKISSALRLQGLAVSESTLSTLDSFGAALGNAEFDAAALEPYAAALEEETAALLEVKSQLPPDDPLSQLLDRVATISYLEAAKYRRGDYSI